MIIVEIQRTQKNQRTGRNNNLKCLGIFASLPDIRDVFRVRKDVFSKTKNPSLYLNEKAWSINAGKHNVLNLFETAERIAFVFENVKNRQEFRDREKVLNFLRQIEQFKLTCFFVDSGEARNEFSDTA
jgi:hypothetical protein